MSMTMEKLSAARKVLVRIVQAREDGAKIMPAILELEHQIAIKTDLGKDLARILAETQ